eukprot:scaffold24617_cov22-Tisochrysis_lutea.AAC.1
MFRPCAPHPPLIHTAEGSQANMPHTPPSRACHLNPILDHTTAGAAERLPAHQLEHTFLVAEWRTLRARHQEPASDHMTTGAEVWHTIQLLRRQGRAVGGYECVCPFAYVCKRVYAAAP